MKVCLGIPFASEEPSRVAARDVVRPLLEDMYPWDDVQEFANFGAELNGGPSFNRGASRNSAVRYFSDADVVVLCDADSYPEPEPLENAISAAYRFGLVHFPFDIVNVLAPSGAVAYTYGPSQGGCWVFRPETWWQAGGMEERLSGWGQEDRIFLITNQTLVGQPIFHPGNLYCVYHDRSDSVFDPRDAEIFAEYEAVAGDVAAMTLYLERRR